MRIKLDRYPIEIVATEYSFRDRKSVIEMYSKLKEMYKEDDELIKYPFPIIAIGIVAPIEIDVHKDYKITFRDITLGAGRHKP